MKDWGDWNVYDWSAALLDYYFAIGEDGDDEPVRTLVVTDDHLARIPRQSVEDGELVRQSLIDKTIRAVGDAPYLSYAWKKREVDPPYYIPFLIVACIVAIDADDPDERSYISRLENELAPTSTGNLTYMAGLWEKLASWLDDHSDTHRRLELPDPGGWTRIGHTTRLAFPNRRDQLKLHGVLDQHDLIVEQPPLRPVLSALEGDNTRYSTRFGEELDEFRE